MIISKFTESIPDHATAKSFDRGENYFWPLAVIEEKTSLESQIQALEAEQLQTLRQRLAGEPAITTLIERELKQIQAASLALKQEQIKQSSTHDSAKCRRAIDPTPFRQELLCLLLELKEMLPSEASYHIGKTMTKIRQLRKKVEAFIEVGDGYNALIILEAITSEYIKRWHLIKHSHRDMSNFFNELGQSWTEALVTTELTQEEGQDWAVKLSDWQEEISVYGLEDAFSVAVEVARYGWNDAVIEEMLDLALLDHEGLYQVTEQIAVTHLKVLERQERYKDYLHLAKRITQPSYYLNMLVQLERIQEAVDEALQRITNPGQALTLAQTLRDHNALEEALKVGEYGLTLITNGGNPYLYGGSYDSNFSGSKAMLATWLCELAQEMGKDEQALSAATIAFHESPSLLTYLKVQQLAGTNWLAHRIDLLTYLREYEGYIIQAQIEIFLHEGLIDDAIKAISGDAAPYKDKELEQVISVAIQSRPQWAIQTAQAQAERIINRAKTKEYHHVTTWLKHARAAYLTAGREREWQSYLDHIRQKHRHKYKLIGLLRGM